MMDDIDREVCASLEKAITNSLSDRWKIVERNFHDPGMTLKIAMDGNWGLSIKARINIRYGHGIEESNQ